MMVSETEFDEEEERLAQIDDMEEGMADAARFEDRYGDE